VSDGRPPLRLARTLPASPEAVFEAWTDPASIKECTRRRTPGQYSSLSLASRSRSYSSTVMPTGFRALT
jgi:uncharacterized protein YndB with AHSA1/START domain